MARIESKKPRYYGKFQGQALISLSFDDGREDNYRWAFPLLKKYGLLATYHVVTGFSDGTWEPDYESWLSVDPDAPNSIGGGMTVDQIKECHRYGIEISAHGDIHDNSLDGITDCVDKLKEWGVVRKDGVVDGFASPGSGLTLDSESDFFLDTMTPYFEVNGLLWARSGGVPNQDLADHKGNMPMPPIFDYRLTSVPVYHDTEFEDLIPVIRDAIENRTWCVLMLHSILKDTDTKYDADTWYWDYDKFEQLCAYLSRFPKNQVLVVTMRDGFRYASGLPEVGY